MTKLADLFPTDSPTVQAIYDYYKRVGDSEPQRGYLGASIIGHHCSRYLWYTFRACVRPTFTGRLYRLFQTGDREEPRVCDNLRSIGCEVHAVDENGEQFAIQDFGGHFSGHFDGAVKGFPEAPKTWHVLEIKTHSTKSFAKLKKESVEKSHPQHYAQMQAYMHGTGMKRALYFAVCKETDEIYTERIRYERVYAEFLMQKAEGIITAYQPPPRIATRPDDYRCNQYGRRCDAHEICWGGPRVLHLPEVSCKQCCYATPLIKHKVPDRTRWWCEKHTHDVYPEEGDQGGCPSHLCLPGLFPFAESVASTNGTIYFKNKDDGKEWRHGKSDLTTAELIEMQRSEL